MTTSASKVPGLLSFVLITGSCLCLSVRAADLYWDADGNTSAATGGTQIWTAIDTWRDGSLAGPLGNWIDGNKAHFNASAGIVTVGATAVAPTSAFFEVTGYTLQTDGVATTRSVNGSLLLSSDVNLFLHTAGVVGARNLNIGGSVGGGLGSTLTIQGNQNAANAARVNLSIANSTISVSIIVTESGVGVAGIVATAAGQQITGANITNNSTGKTMLGASIPTDTLGVSSVITGAQGLQISLSGTGGDGSGKVTLTGDNNFSGGTIVNSNTSGQLILNSSTGQALGGTSSVTLTQGTLLLGNSSQINDNAAVALSGGTFHTGGFSETVGALTLSVNSTIDMGNGASILRFDSGARTNGTLSILNWSGNPATGAGTDEVRFTTNLASSFLNQITFAGYNSGAKTFDSGSGYFLLAPNDPTPIPEPGTVFGGLALLGTIGYRERKRLRKLWPATWVI